MDTQSLKEAFSFAADPATRSAFCWGLAIGCTVGFAVGVIVSKWLYCGLRDGFRAARTHFAAKRIAEAEREEQQRQEAAKQEREAALAAAMSGLHRNAQGLLMDDVGHVYCPVCMKSAIRSAASQNAIGDVYCRRCGWRCPIFFTQIVR